MNLTEELIIVTGASKGIGLATVKLALEKGMKVCGWSRKAPANFSHPNFHFVACDVSNYSSVESAYQATLAHFNQSPFALLNNAGLGYFRLFDQLNQNEISEMIQTNVMGVLNCTKVVVSAMKENRKGHIIAVSSIAGTTGIPEGSVYCASKFAVRGFCQSLFKELRPFNIKVSCIYPGSVSTDFFANYPSVQVNDQFMKAEEVAASIFYLLETPANILPVDLELRPMQLKM